jgi:microsomal dipeptidase-like Zn-dependent dipeptidase
MAYNQKTGFGFGFGSCEEEDAASIRGGNWLRIMGQVWG